MNYSYFTRLVQFAAISILAASVSNANDQQTCEVSVQLIDSATAKPLPGLIRVTNVSTNKPIVIKELIQRTNVHWHTIPVNEKVTLPQTKIKIEALHGLETELATKEVDLTGKTNATIKLTLNRFFDANAKGLRSGNTHVHLMKRTHAETLRYLQEVPRGDGLDLVYVSHLRRIPDERHYITNEIVENSLVGGELARLSTGKVLYRPGEEHRHNFGRGGQGYGHVMLLDIAKLIRPVSIGPGIMREGTDGTTLQRGIKEAHRDGATVVWCHNTFGFEDVPNWTAGVLDAQNIFDGGNHGSYKDTFYRYLNLGMNVPFSTGTDWFIYDFNRVYVPIEGKLTSDKWLKQLAAGRSIITNGPMLELEADGHPIGDTIQLSEPKKIKIQGRGIGRAQFRALELVHNGEVIASGNTEAKGGHHVAELNTTIKFDKPGWLTLRIPPDASKTEMGRQLFAHTSPIYVELAGKRVFQREVAEELISEIEQNMAVIKEKGVFATDEDFEKVMNVHREGIKALKKRIAEN